MSGTQLYDTIAATYIVTRSTEPRIAARFWAALGDARTVLNVGAGTGSYEPPGRDITAVEPSAVMRAQRPPDAARCLAATAQNLPFDDLFFDAAMAVCSDHHWPDPVAGLRDDLGSGRWAERNHDLTALEAAEPGARVLGVTRRCRSLVSGQVTG